MCVKRVATTLSQRRIRIGGVNIPAAAAAFTKLMDLVPGKEEIMTAIVAKMWNMEWDGEVFCLDADDREV